jgi:uncharacterized membrane protein YvbJ
MYCPECGMEIDDKSDQCEFCGNPIKNEAGKRKVNKKILIIIFLVGIIGILFLQSSTNNLYMFMVDSNMPVYAVNESIWNESIGQSSNRVWYANATASVNGHMNYLAMETTWYDSSGNVIEEKLAWSQTNLVPGYYLINSTYKLNTTPSEVKLLFFDNPSGVGNDDQSNFEAEFKPGCDGWPS